MDNSIEYQSDVSIIFYSENIMFIKKTAQFSEVFYQDSILLKDTSVYFMYDMQKLVAAYTRSFQDSIHKINKKKLDLNLPLPTFSNLIFNSLNLIQTTKSSTTKERIYNFKSSEKDTLMLKFEKLKKNIRYFSISTEMDSVFKSHLISVKLTNGSSKYIQWNLQEICLNQTVSLDAFINKTKLFFQNK